MEPRERIMNKVRNRSGLCYRVDNVARTRSATSTDDDKPIRQEREALTGQRRANLRQRGIGRKEVRTLSVRPDVIHREPCGGDGW